MSDMIPGWIALGVGLSEGERRRTEERAGSATTEPLKKDSSDRTQVEEPSQ